MLNGYDSIAITLLDALENVETIKVCVGYKYEGKELESWQSKAKSLTNVKHLRGNERMESKELKNGCKWQKMGLMLYRRRLRLTWNLSRNI